MAQDKKQKETQNDGTEITLDALLEKLKDPTILQMAASAQGLKIIRPTENQPKPEVLEKPRGFELKEGMGIADLVEGFNKVLENHRVYAEKLAEQKTKQVEMSVREKEEREERAKIREFAKGKEDFKDLVPIMEPLYQSGRYSLEEAYKIAGGKHLPSETAKSKETPPKEKVTVKEKLDRVPSSIKTDEGEDPEGLKQKPKGGAHQLKAAISQNLEKLLKEEGAEDAILEEDDEV